jgi:hypothetical protein
MALFEMLREKICPSSAARKSSSWLVQNSAVFLQKVAQINFAFRA